MMYVKPTNDPHLARMMAEYRRRIERAGGDPLIGKPPKSPPKTSASDSAD